VDAPLGELLTPPGRPEGALTDEEATGARREVLCCNECLSVARRPVDLTQRAWPADARLPTEAIDGQTGRWVR